MIATPCQRNKAHAEVEGGDMLPTKEWNLRVSGTDEASDEAKEASCSGDSVPRPLGLIALMPIPVNEIRRWGPALH